MAATVRLTEDLTLGAETDRWKKLAIVLPVVATIVSASIGAAATIYLKAMDKPAVVPTPTKTGAGAAASPTPASRNTSRATALALTLGQVVRGSTDEQRWFKFSTTEVSGSHVKIRVKNLYANGIFVVLVTDPAGLQVARELGGANGSVVNFTSPEAKEYYLTVTALTERPSYEVMAEEL